MEPTSNNKIINSMVSFGEAIKTCLTKKYFTVSGRATRAEYWWFQLFYLLVLAGLVLIGVLAQQDFVFGLIGVFLLFMISPLFCVQIRRLHDRGSSGWCMLLSLIPYVGGFIVFIMTLSGSDDDNEWGPNPYKHSIDNDLDTQVVIENITKEDNVSKTEIIL